ncbi:MAG: hypothetical protein JXA21_24135 [Anaerolineae bacterium]|nr:hypothetical protein [Anaerolineae bacterium]
MSRFTTKGIAAVSSLLVIGVLVFCLTVRGCNKAYPERISRWLEGIPCSAPCWEGITPGKTTISDALNLLSQNQFVDQASSLHIQSAGFFGWCWNDSDLSMGNLHYTDNVVDFVSVDLPEEVLLRDVMQAYGEPSHVVAYKLYGQYGDGPFYALDIIYESRGFTLDTGFLYRQPPNMNDRLVFNKLYFRTSPYNPWQSGASTIIPWEGFKDFSFYCRYESGAMCE